MNPARVWVTGAGGLIGSELVRQARERVPSLEVSGLTRDQLELEDFGAVERRFREDDPGTVLHCAGLTRSPACQADPARARRLNVEVTGHLAALCGETGATLLFLSTDLVFDGRLGNYDEDAPTSPLSAYAESKVEAEARVRAAGARHLVIRTSLNHGWSPTGDRSFTEDMLRTARSGGRIPLFVDEYRSPIPAAATARATWCLVRALHPGSPAPVPSGVLHVAGAERLSRWEIGQVLADVLPELRDRLVPGSLREYQGAPRPPDTSLNCTRVARWLDFPLPRFSDWVRSTGPEWR